MKSIGNSTTMMSRSGLTDRTLLFKPRQDVLQNALVRLISDRVRAANTYRHVYKPQVE